MILLGSFLHHEALAEILGRALEDRMRPGDGRRLKLIVNLNSYVVRLYADWFAERLFRNVLGEGVQSRRVHTKGALKDLIVANPHYTDERIRELIARYRRFPEDYYRETPYEGLIFTTGDPPRDAGSRRIKRIRRIAEKCARRLIDYMLEQIRRRADELAGERALRRGIPKDQLITPHEEMVAEFAHAERRVLKAIRDGLFVAAMPHFYIDDIVGIRVVTTPASAQRVDDYLVSCADLSIVDQKQFTGEFSGSNRVVAWRLPKDELCAHPPDESVCKMLMARGVEGGPAEIAAAYDEFIRTDPGHVRFEILTLDYGQLLESEVGRSMHEEHIRAQREKTEYSGRLAQNVESLMIYLFAFAGSALTDLGAPRIKLRGTYLPEYLEGLLQELYAPGAPPMGLTF
ncbi:MAG: hypothetical protein HY744_07630 [Deltaproteobacteria bacterium]|nr:hypothetical protein [Deltaproteobacteria bacterium]